jgi:hypothetical protein
MHMRSVADGSEMTNTFVIIGSSTALSFDAEAVSPKKCKYSVTNDQ